MAGLTRVPLVGRVPSIVGMDVRCMASDSGSGLLGKLNVFGRTSEKKRKERERELAIEELHQRVSEPIVSLCHVC